MDMSPTFIQAFAEYQERRNFSPATVTCRQAVLVAFHRHLRPVGLLDATPADVERWLASRKLGPQGRYTYLSHLHAFYRFVQRRGLVAGDPTVAIDRPKLPRRLPRPITPGELDTALIAAGPRMRAWMLLGAFAGLRRAEIASLRAEDIDADRCRIRVVAGKGNKDGMVPMHPGVLAAIEACGLPRTGPLFVMPSGRQVRPAYVGDSVAAFLRSAGINRTLHSTRHHYGTQLYRLCRDLLLTAKLMRHEDPSSSSLYVEVEDDAGADVVNRLGIGPAPKDSDEVLRQRLLAVMRSLDYDQPPGLIT